MKILFFLSLSIFLPCFVVAQSNATPKAVEKIMKDVRMGMPLADFKKLRPKAVLDNTSSSRIEYVEAVKTDGIKEITYYFDDEGIEPFYEVIIEFDNENIKTAVGTKFFGAFNHPSEKNHWVIYNGNEGFLTVGWVYEAKVIFAGKVPSSGYYNDVMFNIPTNFAKIDNRINKNDVFKPIENKVVKPNNNKTDDSQRYTCTDYGTAINSIFSLGIGLKKTTADSILFILPKAKKQPQTVDFRDEYVYQPNENGLKLVTFYFGKKDKKPLYEVIFEFENEDTTRQFAELELGKPNHPSLDNHWVLAQGDKGISSLAWVFGANLIIAGNLPNTELEKEEDFILPDSFVLNPDNNKKNTSDETTQTDEHTVVTQINTYLEAANGDFDDLKDEAVEGKKEVYKSKIAYHNSEQTIIRKNTAGKWRLEGSFSPTNADDATELYDKQLTLIQNLEGLNYRLVKKNELNSTAGKSYVWDVQTLDDVSTNIILKLQMYKTSTGEFAVKLEIGK